MNLTASIVAFWAGVGLSNIAQWGKWVDLHRGEPKIGYWKQGGGWGHLMGNLLFDAVVCAAWTSGLFDWLQAKGLSTLPGGYPIPGYLQDIPVNPGLGVFLGGMADYVGDDIVFWIRRRFGWLFNETIDKAGVSE